MNYKNYLCFIKAKPFVDRHIEAWQIFIFIKNWKNNSGIVSSAQTLWKRGWNISSYRILYLKKSTYNIQLCSDRACARALREPVFLGSLTSKRGRCAPTAPPIGASLILLAKLMIYRKPCEKSSRSSGKFSLLSLSKPSPPWGAGRNMNPAAAPALQQASVLPSNLSYPAPKTKSLVLVIVTCTFQNKSNDND